MSIHNNIFVDILPGPPNSSTSPITPTDGHFDVHSNNLAFKNIHSNNLSNMEATYPTSNNQSVGSVYNPQIADIGIPLNYPYLMNNNYGLYQVPNQSLERNDLVQPIFVPQQSSLPEGDCSLMSRSAAENTQTMLDCSSNWQMETKDDVYQLRFIPDDVNRMSQAFDHMPPLVGYQVKFEDLGTTNVSMPLKQVNDYAERVDQDFRQAPTPSSAASPGPASPNPVSQKPPVYTKWTEEEDELLRAAITMYGPHKWSLIAAHVPNRTPMQCSTRWLGALNPTIHKGRWTPEEDAALKEAVAEYIHALDADGNPQPIPWNKIATRIPHRTGIQCQARWSEALDPRVRKGKWSSDEDDILKEGVKRFGRCWIRIAEMINGRTQRQCRTRWVQIQNKQAKQDRDARTGTQATSISSSPKSETSLPPLSPPKKTPPIPSTISSASPTTSKLLHSNLVDRSQIQIGNGLTPTMEMSLNSMLKVQSVGAGSPQMVKNGLNSRTDDPRVNTIQNGDQLSMFVDSYPY
ncbi:10047_t:CDS:2 [Paraglomus occultum]|uniref:10047_t:CDS:1 n=1 Tax=Paraglomus occultum TaxID=144539 RepID=A0A9N9FNK7_9GLOM|nr:10047_t:CDS:2 [Paraglomus occultum]